MWHLSNKNDVRLFLTIFVILFTNPPSYLAALFNNTERTNFQVKNYCEYPLIEAPSGFFILRKLR